MGEEYKVDSMRLDHKDEEEMAGNYHNMNSSSHLFQKLMELAKKFVMSLVSSLLIPSEHSLAQT